MICPECRGDTKIVNGRWHKQKNFYVRTRLCLKCARRFGTVELVSSVEDLLNNLVTKVPIVGKVNR